MPFIGNYSRTHSDTPSASGLSRIPPVRPVLPSCVKCQEKQCKTVSERLDGAETRTYAVDMLVDAQGTEPAAADFNLRTAAAKVLLIPPGTVRDSSACQPQRRAAPVCSPSRPRSRRSDLRNGAAWPPSAR